MAGRAVWDKTCDTELLQKKWTAPPTHKKYTVWHWIRQGHESQWKADTHIFSSMKRKNKHVSKRGWEQFNLEY